MPFFQIKQLDYVKWIKLDYMELFHYLFFVIDEGKNMLDVFVSWQDWSETDKYVLLD